MGYLSGAYKYLTNAVFGGQANIQSKAGSDASFTYLYLKGNYPSGASSQWKNTETAKWEGANGVSCNLLSRTITVDGGDWATASGSIQRATAAKTISELTLGDEGQVLTVEKAAIDGGGLVWATPAGNTNYYADSLAFNTGDGDLVLGRTSPLANLTGNLDGRYLTSQYGQAGATNYVGYFSGSNNITGTSGLQYDASTFTVTGGHVTSIVNIVTLSHDLTYDILPEDYHVHITNDGDPTTGAGLAQATTLPAISIGRVVYLSTSGSTPVHSGINTITLSASGSDTINTALSSTVLSTNGNNNYDTFRFVAESATNW